MAPFPSGKRGSAEARRGAAGAPERGEGRGRTAEPAAPPGHSHEPRSRRRCPPGEEGPALGAAPASAWRLQAGARESLAPRSKRRAWAANVFYPEHGQSTRTHRGKSAKRSLFFLFCVVVYLFMSGIGVFLNNPEKGRLRHCVGRPCGPTASGWRGCVTPLGAGWGRARRGRRLSRRYHRVICLSSLPWLCLSLSCPSLSSSPIPCALPHPYSHPCFYPSPLPHPFSPFLISLLLLHLLTPSPCPYPFPPPSTMPSPFPRRSPGSAGVIRVPSNSMSHLESRVKVIPLVPGIVPEQTCVLNKSNGDKPHFRSLLGRWCSRIQFSFNTYFAF